jgi:twitching motility protein PilT
MQTMDQCLQRLVAQGQITQEDAKKLSKDKQPSTNF